MPERNAGPAADLLEFLCSAVSGVFPAAMLEALIDRLVGAK